MGDLELADQLCLSVSGFRRGSREPGRHGAGGILNAQGVGWTRSPMEPIDLPAWRFGSGGPRGFWRADGGELPGCDVEPEELTVVRSHGNEVRRRSVSTVLLPVVQAVPVLTGARAMVQSGNAPAGFDA